MAQLIVNPDANPESTTVDGQLFKQNSTNWATSRDATVGEGADDSSGTQAIAGTGKLVTSGNFQIIRGVFLFNLSTIPVGSVINSATFEVYATSVANGDNDGQDYISVVSSNPASNTALVAEDYDQLGTTKYTDDIDLGSITTSAYNTWTFNATGITAIQSAVGSILKIGMREGHDIEDAPYAGANNTFDRLAGDFSDGTNKPKLTINYTQSSFFLMF